MMKNICLLLVFILPASLLSAQPGKYAGTKKNFIGKEFADAREINELATWTYIEGKVLTPVNNPELITADVFKKGTTFLVLFSTREDTASDSFVITDVLEIKSVLQGWTIKTGFCRQNKTENSWLIAWAKETVTEFTKTIKKAWRFNPDKRRIELTPVKGIDCINIVS
jgi:hypothetical protein